MPEILTESFCERCGTRYTFESATPRTTKLKGIRVLSRGFKNFVMSDDTSIDEAMAAARSESDREVTSQQLDAFHKTFNFCMSCRQYTCANCWNEAEGRCLTCAPHLGHEILAAPFPDVDARGGLALTNGLNGAHAAEANGHASAEPAESLAWPMMDLDRDIEAPEVDASSTDIPPIDAAARLAALDGPMATTEVEPIAEVVAQAELEVEPIAEVVAQAELEVEPIAEVVAQAELEVEPIAEVAAGVVPTDMDERAAAAAAQTIGLLRRFRPGQSLDAEIEAFEREQAAVVATPDPIEVAPIVDTAPVESTSLEVAAAAGTSMNVDDEPVVEAPAAPAEPGAGVAATDDRVEQPTWRIVAPDDQAPPTSGTGPASDRTTAPAEPRWPTQPEWPSQGRAAAGLPFLGRPARPTGTLESLWAESAREVAAAPAPLPMAQSGATTRASGGVQPCVSCGLSLSATARFCRRCGSSQG